MTSVTFIELLQQNLLLELSLLHKPTYQLLGKNPVLLIKQFQMCFSTKHQMEVLCMKSFKSSITSLVKGVSTKGGSFAFL